jgi:hypothetical protein
MNRSLKYLLLTALAASIANISATTQHTYLNRRPANVNLPMELTTFNERTQAKLGNHLGGNFQVSGFYGETNKNIGKYFGINNKSTYILQTNAYTAAPSTDDFDLGYIIYDAVPGAKVEVSLDPHSTEYGARFDYYKNADKLLKGLYFKANTTVVCVKNKMELKVPGSDVEGSIAETVKEFLKGNYDTNQSALTFGKMAGEHSKTGFADVDVILGYKFLEKEKYHAGINIALTIPTGNNPKGREIFEPVHGNYSHVGFGGGVDAHANLWTSASGKHDLKLNLVANYRYLFEASENRSLKLKGYASPYVMVGVINQTALIPAVDLLTPYGVQVTPGSQFDGILAFAYNCGGFSADLGYNLYARGSENVHFKGEIPENFFGVASRNYNIKNPFELAEIDTYLGTGTWLTNDDVDANAAATPSQFTNGIYGGLGYHFKDWKKPFLMGIGGKYDWASKNSEFNNWSIWAKISLSF